ncbi:MAG: hypothetical protein N3B01_04450 [Verrucomicrobiae bacterium]|nr:hypothetical protein [Verrucomicrobiae bacterium]
MKARILVTIAVGALLATSGCKRQPSGPATAESATFAPLTGRWIRHDGGYMLMVHRVSPDGTANVGYFNPNPIRVSDARASLEDGNLYLFVELRDVGYPGCTYRLTYDKARDRLIGTYYQAAQRQTYDIVFERAP